MQLSKSGGRSRNRTRLVGFGDQRAPRATAKRIGVSNGIRTRSKEVHSLPAQPLASTHHTIWRWLEDSNPHRPPYKSGARPLRRNQQKRGAVGGNRTRISTLPKWQSAADLQPQTTGADDRARTGTYDFTRVACCHSHSIRVAVLRGVEPRSAGRQPAVLPINERTKLGCGRESRTLRGWLMRPA